jgi:hypothetical protein
MLKIFSYEFPFNSSCRESISTKVDVFQQILTKFQVSSFMNISSVVPEVLYVDRQKSRHGKVIIDAFLHLFIVDMQESTTPI